MVVEVVSVQFIYFTVLSVCGQPCTYLTSYFLLSIFGQASEATNYYKIHKASNIHKHTCALDMQLYSMSHLVVVTIMSLFLCNNVISYADQIQFNLLHFAVQAAFAKSAAVKLDTSYCVKRNSGMFSPIKYLVLQSPASKIITAVSRVVEPINREICHHPYDKVITCKHQIKDLYQRWHNLFSHLCS